MKNIKNQLIAFGTAMVTFSNIIPVKAEGLDTSGIKNWITSYLNPFKDVLTWGVPIVTGIVCLIIGVRYLAKEADGEQQKSYITQIKPVLITAAILMAIDIFLQAFSIVRK